MLADGGKLVLNLLASPSQAPADPPPSSILRIAGFNGLAAFLLGLLQFLFDRRLLFSEFGEAYNIVFCLSVLDPAVQLLEPRLVKPKPILSNRLQSHFQIQLAFELGIAPIVNVLLEACRILNGRLFQYQIADGLAACRQAAVDVLQAIHVVELKPMIPRPDAPFSGVEFFKPPGYTPPRCERAQLLRHFFTTVSKRVVHEILQAHCALHLNAAFFHQLPCGHRVDVGRAVCPSQKDVGQQQPPVDLAPRVATLDVGRRQQPRLFRIKPRVDAIEERDARLPAQRP